MSTGQDIIEGALRKTGILGAEETIESQQLQDGLDDLNDWGSLFEASSLALGFVPLNAATDTINIPREAEGVYKTNLAVYLLDQYGMPPNPVLVNNASKMKEMLLSAFKPKMKQAYPDSLPLGSGNSDQMFADDQRFFDPNPEQNF